jgi:hypothetical protein
MRSLAIAFARIGIGATVGAWLISLRRRRRDDAEKAEIARFEDLITAVSDEELQRCYESYQMLTALESNPLFRRKRDTCLAEMDRRATRASEVRKSGGG